MIKAEDQKWLSMVESQHYADASAREKLIEHVFLGDLLRCLWRRKVSDVAVLRPEVDSAGYDLALEHGGQIRHVQLKSSHRYAKRAAITANIRLLERPAACILWIYFDPDTLLLGPFLWFGAAPGERIPGLGEKLATHTKHDAEGKKGYRPLHRVIPKSSFTQLDTMDAVVQRLFRLDA